MKPTGQSWTTWEIKRDLVVVEFATNASGTTWWPNFPLKQVAPPGGQTVTAKCNCHNLNIEFCLFNHAHSENSFEQVKIDNEIVKQIALEEKKIEITK